jgi:hypothetical protein
MRKRQVNLSEAKLKLDDEVERLRSTSSAQARELDSLHREIKEKDEVIASLNERFLHYEESYSLMVSELMEFKNKAIENRGFFQKYNLVKVSAVRNSPCTVRTTQILAKKDETSTCYFEIVSKGKTTVLCGADIQEVGMHPVNPTRFFIRAVLGTKADKLMFQCDEAREICSSLKEFLGWTPRSMSMIETPF